MLTRFFTVLAGACCALWGGAAVCAAPAGASSLTVNVAGIRSANGAVVVTLCRAGEAFPAGCKMKNGAHAVKGVTKVRFGSLPPGSYAVAVFHDEDGDGKLTFIKEGIGFSNNSNLTFGPPKFEPAAFRVQGTTAITLNIKYFS